MAAGGNAGGRGASGLPKLAAGYKYGPSISPSQMQKGDTFYHPGTLRHGSMSGVISKVNPKTISYERHTEFSGAEKRGGKWVDIPGPHMAKYTARHEDVFGGYVQRGNIVHPVKER